MVALPFTRPSENLLELSSLSKGWRQARITKNQGCGRSPGKIVFPKDLSSKTNYF